MQAQTPPGPLVQLNEKLAPSASSGMPLGALLGMIGGVLVGTWALSRLIRVRPLSTLPAPRPATDYEGALARVSALQAQDRGRVNGVCRSRLLTHGAKTHKAVALLHGLTNCPAQYVQFAQMLYERGYNVLLPRLKYHGLERDSFDFNDLTAEEMVAGASEASDILHGLGDERILLGFSAGGAAAAWAAQFRGDLDRVILVAPALALKGAPMPLQRILVRALGALPSRSLWWDPILKHEYAGLPHAYPRAGTHVVSELLRLGMIVEVQAGRQIYAARSVTLITNPNDEVVNNGRALRAAKEWRRQGVLVEEYTFPKEWGLIHDLFDPAKAEQQIDRTYPQLIEWLRL